MHHIFTWVIPLVTKGFFVLFWCVTIIAFMSRSRTVRNLYLGFFFASMLIPAVGGIRWALWPFHNWNLWPGVLAHDLDYFELWLEDDRGQQAIYDLRAISPHTPALLNLFYVPRMVVQLEQGEPSPLAAWLLEKANAYEPTTSLRDRFGFPKREPSHYQVRGRYENADISPRWPVNHGTFVALVIKKKHAVFLNRSGVQAQISLVGETRYP